MIGKDELIQLHTEVQLGHKAEQAYNVYVKAHIEKVVVNIYTQIENCSVSDTETLVKLKGLLSAIRGLESSISNDIDTGRLAEKQLRENDGN